MTPEEIIQHQNALIIAQQKLIERLAAELRMRSAVPPVITNPLSQDDTARKGTPWIKCS